MGSIIRKNSPTVARIFGNKQTQLKTDAEANLFVTVSQSNDGLITSFQDVGATPVQSTAIADGDADSGADVAALVAGYQSDSNSYAFLRQSPNLSLLTSTPISTDSIGKVTATSSDPDMAAGNALTTLASITTRCVILSINIIQTVLVGPPEFACVIIYSTDF